MKSLATRANQKLNPRYYGLFEVLVEIREVSYKPQLPPEALVHLIFHVSLLKRCISLGVQSQSLPPGLIGEWELNVEPVEMFALRKNQQEELELLVKWKDLPNFESSWELATIIKEHFPSFHLEDKVVLLEGNDVSIP